MSKIILGSFVCKLWIVYVRKKYFWQEFKKLFKNDDINGICHAGVYTRLISVIYNFPRERYIKLSLISLHFSSRRVRDIFIWKKTLLNGPN